MRLKFLYFLMLSTVSILGTASDWLHYGGDAGGKHYSPLQQIDRDNVDTLKPAWIHRSGDTHRYSELMQRASGQATPILLPESAGQSLVYCTAFNRVIALDPGSGEQRWEFDPQINTEGQRPFRCRGVSYWYAKKVESGNACQHRIYLASHDRRLFVVDAKTGHRCSSFGQKGEIRIYGEEGYQADLISNSSPPVIANDLIVVGSSVIDFAKAVAPRGTIRAYDAYTGELRWQFDPLAGIDHSGGGNAWAPLSVDATLGYVYIPTSAPSPDYYGVLRPGNNAYANAIVALQIDSGEVAWSYQLVHHDLWDYDTPAQPILFDWPSPQGEVPALAQVTKQGYVFLFDRRNGRPLFPIEERAVPGSDIPGENVSPTQPVPLKPPALLKTTLSESEAWGLTFWDRNDCRKKIAALNNQGPFTPVSEQATLMLPGSLGGANWGGGAYWSEQNLLLVNVNTVAFVGQLIPSKRASNLQDHPAAGETMHVTMQGTPYTAAIGSLQSMLGIPCSPPPWGKLVALDLARGEIRWEAPLGSVHELGPVNLPFHIDWGTPNLGGGVVTASGLFFIGATMDSLIRAFDARTGEQLWHYPLQVDATATPMSYLYNGKQYLVINAGGHNMFKRKVGDYLYAFALPGNDIDKGH